MDRFIWIGNHFVNLDCIVRFTLEDGGKRIEVFLKGVDPQYAKIIVGGADAEHLRIELGKAQEVGLKDQVTISVPVSSGTAPPEQGATIDS